MAQTTRQLISEASQYASKLHYSKDSLWRFSTSELSKMIILGSSDEEYLTTKQTAQLLQTTWSNVNRLAHTSKLPFVKIRGKKLFPKSLIAKIADKDIAAMTEFSKNRVAYQVFARCFIEWIERVKMPINSSVSKAIIATFLGDKRPQAAADYTGNVRALNTYIGLYLREFGNFITRSHVLAAEIKELHGRNKRLSIENRAMREQIKRASTTSEVPPHLLLPDSISESIAESPLSPRAKHCLSAAGIITTAQLMGASQEFLSRVRNLGAKTLHEIIAYKQIITLKQK